MVKADLVEIIAREAHITKVSAEVAVNAIIGTLKNALARGERIELRGFGLTSDHANVVSDAILVPVKKSLFHRGRLLGSGPAKVSAT